MAGRKLLKIFVGDFIVSKNACLCKFIENELFCKFLNQMSFSQITYFTNDPSVNMQQLFRERSYRYKVTYSMESLRIFSLFILYFHEFVSVVQVRKTLNMQSISKRKYLWWQDFFLTVFTLTLQCLVSTETSYILKQYILNKPAAFSFCFV